MIRTKPMMMIKANKVLLLLMVMVNKIKQMLINTNFDKDLL